MPSNIPKSNKLLVVSDTSLTDKEGLMLGFEPVVRELDSISNLFDEIIWLGYGQRTIKSAVAVPRSANIKLVAMPATGGGGLLGMINILCYYPVYLFYILKYMKGATHIHTRAPSHPALLAMYISRFDKKRTYWHKYAGNWNESNPPRSYGFQRELLKKIVGGNIYATINGQWHGQQKNILTFENPCLTEKELEYAKSIGESKDFTGKLILLFVGNLSAFKGIRQLVNAIEKIEKPARIEELIIAGDGELRIELDSLAQLNRNVKIRVLGAINRDELVKVYSKAHVNILPSSSEGFPKVIAEGAAFGCIPLVTDVSSISQYIHEGENGFLLENNSEQTIIDKLNQLVDVNELKSISLASIKISIPFTYEYFNQRIRHLFINN